MGFFDAIGLTRKITRPRIRAFLERYRTDGKTLDIGCGNRLYGDLFPNAVSVDRAPREGVTVDVVADAHDLRAFGDGSFDTVLCTEVLEHLHTPAQAIAEFRRVLRPGGTLLLTTRFVYPLHDTPGDYYRFTKYGLRHLLRDFEIVELIEEAGTVETLAVLCQRIGFQCDTLWLKPLKCFWFLSALLLRALRFVITREFGDIGHGRESLFSSKNEHESH